jgi:hypothetical protein
LRNCADIDSICFLDRGFDTGEPARRFALDVAQFLHEAILHDRKAAIVILHLVAEQQLADLVDAGNVGGHRTIHGLDGVGGGLAAAVGG